MAWSRVDNLIAAADGDAVQVWSSVDGSLIATFGEGSRTVTFNPINGDLAFGLQNGEIAVVPRLTISGPTPTFTLTATLTSTFTPTATFTSTPTSTFTFTSTITSTPTSTFTPTFTPTLIVTCTATAADPAGLVSAITTANANGASPDTICLNANATYALTSALPTITTPITIIGNGAILERGSGAPQFRAFNVTASGALTLQNLTIRNFSTTEQGGAIRTAGSLTLDGVTFTANRARFGGAVYVDDGAVSLATARCPRSLASPSEMSSVLKSSKVAAGGSAVTITVTPSSRRRAGSSPHSAGSSASSSVPGVRRVPAVLTAG
jgi:predicted outer membrane repeat protein